MLLIGKTMRESIAYVAITGRVNRIPGDIRRGFWFLVTILRAFHIWMFIRRVVDLAQRRPANRTGGAAIDMRLPIPHRYRPVPPGLIAIARFAYCMGHRQNRRWVRSGRVAT